MLCAPESFQQPFSTYMDTDLALPERIMDALEVVMRRHGVAKTNVVDVAQVLGMSHANIYRHFPSKKALLAAVAARWLHQISTPLQAIADDAASPASERLAAWFNCLRQAKQDKVRQDPELFRIYHTATEQSQEVVDAHVATLLAQLERIVADGMAAGEFVSGASAATTARVFLLATVRFHHPALVTQDLPPAEEDARALCELLLTGLSSPPRSRRQSAELFNDH